MIQERLSLLRQKMREAGIAIYVVPSTDYHESEYVCAYFRAREYLTGFTGSAGTVVITLTEAGLWTDGRYFIQAKKQLEGSTITLYRMGEPGVPTIEEYILNHLKEGEALGFDGRVLNSDRAEKLVEMAKEKGAKVQAKIDLVGSIWEDRPPIPKSKLFVLETKWSGESSDKKISRVRKEMERLGADVHVLSSLCDIAWILNIRGGDIPCVPVVFSFLVLTKEECTWYVRPEVLEESIQAYCRQYSILLKNYQDIYRDLGNLKRENRVLLDKKTVNYHLLTSISEGAKIINHPNPSELMKAVKNITEIANLKKAHLKESVAFTKFIYWVKTSVGKESITELSASDYLIAKRKEQEHCLGQSFSPICAYGANAAIVHYSATEESNAKLRPEGFLLVDAGGHYLEGTTDTTRTIALGPLKQEQKKMFTAVCRGNFRLACSRFLKGCSGHQLDILCREALWELGMDFKHGTGHGVGYLLNVHEGPNAFRWSRRPNEEEIPLEPGMVTTNEPGVYIEGDYGIRTENELVCVLDSQNQYGQFLKFEILTLVPIDLDAVLPEEMSEAERAFLNSYHEKVYRKLSPYLLEEERIWLKKYTRNI